MPDRPSTRFRLGAWLVEPDLNRLSTAKESVQVEPKTMAVLVYLCRYPGQVVSTDEIIVEVWGGRPMGDNPVYKSIAKLRRTLGDDPNNPRFVATVPKKGYRLVCSVADLGPSAGSVTAREAPEAPVQAIGRVPLIAAGLVAGVVIAGVLFWRPQDGGPPSIGLVSSFSGSHSQPSFGPDRGQMAFVSDADGMSHIWVLEPGSPNPRQLTTGDSADARPRWSPDGQSILFVRRNNLWSVPAAGGQPAEIVRQAYNPNWSLDGTRLVFERRYEIWTADADGSRQERLVGVPQRELPLAPRWPALSPDATQVVYFQPEDTPQGDLWIIPAAGGEPERLTFDPAFGSAPVWSPDGSYIIYSSQRGGSRTLWRVSVSDKMAEALLVGSGDDDFPDVTADGTKVAYTNSRQRFAIVLSDPTSGKHRELYESRQAVLAPELSPDGHRLVFFGADRTGGFQIFTLPLAGGTPRMITSDPHTANALPQWSGDGKAFYFFHTGTDTSFKKIGAAGGEIELIVEGWDWNVANGARVDPGEMHIIYSRLTGQVPVQTSIRDLATAQDKSFYATLEYPRWSADGTTVAGSWFIDQRFPGDVAICPLAGAECLMLAESARIPVWSSDESDLYFVRGFGEAQELFVVPSNGTGGERKVMDMAPLFPLGPFYDVTADGSIVWVRYEEGRNELWVAELP